MNLRAVGSACGWRYRRSLTNAKRAVFARASRSQEPNSSECDSIRVLTQLFLDFRASFTLAWHCEPGGTFQFVDAIMGVETRSWCGVWRV
jgi:hypothetical protein